MVPRFRVLFVSMMLAGAPLLTAPANLPAQMQAGAPSLYKRLGGYDALAAVTDDFIGRLATDAKLSRFFGGHSKDSFGRIRQLIVDQLCNLTGGPCVYIGRDMKAAHQGLGITEDDWTVTVMHLTETLNKFKVPAKEQSEVLTALGSVKGDIIEHKM